MFKRNSSLAPQFPTEFPTSSENLGFGSRTERQTFGSVGLTNNTPDEIQPEAFIRTLLNSPGSETKSELVNAYFEVKERIETFLEETRAARLADLTERHNAAVAEARKTSAVFETARFEEFTAQKAWEGLADKARAARNDLATGQHGLKTMDRSLTTRAELATKVAHVETLKAKAVKTADAEGVALNKYHKLLAETGEAERAHQQAVSAAAELSGQIDSL